MRSGAGPGAALALNPAGWGAIGCAEGECLAGSRPPVIGRISPSKAAFFLVTTNREGRRTCLDRSGALIDPRVESWCRSTGQSCLKPGYGSRFRFVAPAKAGVQRLWLLPSGSWLAFDSPRSAAAGRDGAAGAREREAARLEGGSHTGCRSRGFFGRLMRVNHWRRPSVLRVVPAMQTCGARHVRRVASCTYTIEETR